MTLYHYSRFLLVALVLTPALVHCRRLSGTWRRRWQRQPLHFRAGSLRAVVAWVPVL